MTPLVVIAGFLGAGKTSFLRRLLPRLVQRRIVPFVIVNDYLNADVDARQLREFARSVAPINGACVCCGSRDELLETLQALNVPENSVLLLEANGTADTLELLELLAATSRAARFTHPVQLGVVDAKRWQQRHWNNEIEALQARTATYLSVTHRDEVDDARWNEVAAALRKLNPNAEYVADDIQFVELITAMVRDAARTPERSATNTSEPRHRHGHEKHHFSALEIPLPPLVEEAALRKFLEDLPADVVRAKGLVVFTNSPGDAWLFQKIEGKGASSFMKLGTSSDITPLIILIGPRLPETDLRAAVAALSANA